MVGPLVSCKSERLQCAGQFAASRRCRGKVCQGRLVAESTARRLPRTPRWQARVSRAEHARFIGARAHLRLTPLPWRTLCVCQARRRQRRSQAPEGCLRSDPGPHGLSSQGRNHARAFCVENARQSVSGSYVSRRLAPCLRVRCGGRETLRFEPLRVEGLPTLG